MLTLEAGDISFEHVNTPGVTSRSPSPVAVIIYAIFNQNKKKIYTHHLNNCFAPFLVNSDRSYKA